MRDRGPNNRTRARAVPILEQANTTVQNTTEVRKHPFHFDTGATTHMCPYPERFIDLIPSSGFVTSSSRDKMVVEGKGCVLLNCQLSNGTVSPLIIENVLFVPKLTLPLFS